MPNFRYPDHRECPGARGQCVTRAGWRCCSSCRRCKPRSNFTKRGGGFLRTCRGCRERTKIFHDKQGRGGGGGGGGGSGKKPPKKDDKKDDDKPGKGKCGGAVPAGRTRTGLRSQAKAGKVKA